LVGDPCFRSVVKLYVGTFKIKYPPSKAKIKSGDQAASTAGNWLMFPMDSNNPATVQ
jgi:hypothetical protein